jgi:hypothetical protein
MAFAEQMTAVMYCFCLHHFKELPVKTEYSHREQGVTNGEDDLRYCGSAFEPAQHTVKGMFWRHCSFLMKP